MRVDGEPDVVLVPDRGGQCEQAFSEASTDPGGGAPTVAFEVELALRLWLTDSMI